MKKIIKKCFQATRLDDESNKCYVEKPNCNKIWRLGFSSVHREKRCDEFTKAAYLYEGLESNSGQEELDCQFCINEFHCPSKCTNVNANDVSEEQSPTSSSYNQHDDKTSNQSNILSSTINERCNDMEMEQQPIICSCKVHENETKFFSKSNRDKSINVRLIEQPTRSWSLQDFKETENQFKYITEADTDDDIIDTKNKHQPIPYSYREPVDMDSDGISTYSKNEKDFQHSRKKPADTKGPVTIIMPSYSQCNARLRGARSECEFSMLFCKTCGYHHKIIILSIMEKSEDENEGDDEDYETASSTACNKSFAFNKGFVQYHLQAMTVFARAPIEKPIVWVLGGPGSGKGTQCDKIIAKYGFTHLSTGDLLRAEVKSGSERGKNLTAIMERGELVPNELVLDLLKAAIEANLASSKGFLIDGYPREKSQGIEFEKTIAPCTVILYFEASQETLTKRLLGRAASSGRADDNEDTIKLRLKTFLENNDQVLAQYPDKLKRINAERGVDDIFGEVVSILDSIVEKA